VHVFRLLTLCCSSPRAALSCKPCCVTPQAQQAPELLRVPLESVVMTVKAIFGPAAPAQAVLGRAVTPPDANACRSAVDALKVTNFLLFLPLRLR